MAEGRRGGSCRRGAFIAVATEPKLRVRAIGSSPSVQRPGRACSAYLVRTAQANVLLDAGSGAIGNLQTALAYGALDAIVISHMHADHFFDIVPLRYGLTYAQRRATPLPLWLPPNGSPTLQAIAAPFAGERRDFFGSVFEVREYDPGRTLTIADLALTFAPALHYIEAYAIRAQTPGARFTYSGDTAPCDAVVAHARSASLFLCEATLGLGSESSPRGHSSAREAGTMARRADVEHLALTHYYSDAEPADLIAAARGEFAGPITVVDDGMEFSLPFD